MGANHGDRARAVHAGLPDVEQGAPFLPGPTFAAPYHLKGDPYEADLVYGRYGNPTWTRYEQALGELEGGHAVLFASGMAAVTAALLPRLRSGDTLVLPSDCYHGVRKVAETFLAERGVELRLLPTPDPGFADAIDGATLVWLETPTNPGLEVCDLRLLIERAHAAGALVGVDNTFATPLGQLPLELGADFVMASASKALTGHADLILGYLAARDGALADEFRAWRTETGAVPGPFETWLAHRSLATLGVRFEAACVTAQALAERLAARDDVQAVRYPGLPDDPSHAIAGKQMKLFGSIVCFTLDDADRAERFLSECRLLKDATSFGGVVTSAERRARWRGDDVPEGFIRLSVGCEATEDVIADIERALDASAVPVSSR
jgi:cystathionine gamma-lyase